jgi:hypothetical protein
MYLSSSLVVGEEAADSAELSDMLMIWRQMMPRRDVQE